jgi:hypothetical protein
VSPGRPDDEPVVPERSGDDTDRGWGDEHTDDDERITRERPPHW